MFRLFGEHLMGISFFFLRVCVLSIDVPPFLSYVFLLFYQYDGCLLSLPLAWGCIEGRVDCSQTPI